MSSGRSESLAEIIRRERLTHAWTQEQLALVASVNLRTVQRVERGLPCSGETKQALAGAVNLDAGVLADRERGVWLGGGARVRRRQ